MSNLNRSSFIRFAFVGGSATALQWLIMWCLMATTGMASVPASTIGYLLSAVFNYWANARFTFTGDHDHRASIMRFVATLCAGIAINALVLYIVEQLGAPTWLAQFIATGAVFLWNYFINAIWTFRKRPTT